MPVLLGGNIAVSHDTKADFRRLQSRRQSRVCVYLHTAHTKEEEGESVFKDSDVENLLKGKEERKRKLKLQKLKLVWKGTYKYFTKSSKEAMQEYLDNRGPKQKVRFTSPHPRTKSVVPRHFEKSLKHSKIEITSDAGIGSVANSDKSHYQRMTSKSDSRGRKRLSNHGTINASPSLSGVDTKSPTEFSLQRLDTYANESWLRDESSLSRDRISARLQFVKRFSRSIFNTKKATHHQERNMFLYRIEKKRQREEFGTESRIQTNPAKLYKSRNSTMMQNTETTVTSNVTMTAVERTVQLEREKRIPELKSKVDVDTILRAYLSEQFLDLNLRGPEADALRHIYTATILNQPMINNLINKHPDMLPSRIFKDLVKFKRGFEVNPIYSPTVVKAEKSSWRDIYRKTLSPPSGNILVELENDMPQYANFYKILIEKRNENTVCEGSWVKERKLTVIRENLLHTSVNLRIGRQNPGSVVRFDMLRIFAAAARNERLLRQLSLSIEGWLDQLVKGLYSPFKSVREETCQVLCLMTASYPIMRELYLSKYFDVIQDLSLAIFRAIDQYEDTFPEYYILLAHIIHYSPSRSIIECILDRWTNFRCVGLILQWPRLLYYALRYWPDDELCLGNRLFCIRITKALEAGLQRPLSTKACRSALYYLQMRFRNVSHLFTIYHNKESAQSSFMTARAQLCV